jgi:GNAT superfamily N-acetyltransferase
MLFSYLEPAAAMEVEPLARGVILASPHYSVEAKRHLTERLSASELLGHANLWNEAVILVRHEGRLVGFSLASRLTDALELHWVIVDPKARRLRVGPALHDVVLRQARHHGFHKVWGVCRTTNAGVARHVVRQGRRVVGTLRKHAFGQDYILWEHVFD